MGRVKSLSRNFLQRHYSGCYSHYHKDEKVLKIQKQRNGYYTIDLHKDKTLKRVLIHRLVAQHFIENTNNYKYINHIDSNPQNNNVDNLEWCTQKYNIQYAYDNGRKIPPHQKEVVQINENGITINTYKSTAEASRKTGIQQVNIAKCARKERNHAGGYKWEYTKQK